VGFRRARTASDYGGSSGTVQAQQGTGSATRQRAYNLENICGGFKFRLRWEALISLGRQRKHRHLGGFDLYA